MEEKRAEEGGFEGWYNKHSNLLLIIPLLMYICSIFYLSSFYSENGDIMRKDITLTGGTTITVYTKEKIDVNQLENALASTEVSKLKDSSIRTLADLRTGEQIAFSVESEANSDELQAFLENYLGYKLDGQNSSTEFTGQSLSKSFYKELITALVLAFAFMSIAVFLIFKTFAPSLTVILSAFTDIFFTLIIADIAGMKISTAGIAAFLMLIGYSVDTDILLTNRLLRRHEGNIFDRLISAVKTGTTMTLTGISAVLLAYFLVVSPVLKEVFIILVIGLSIDLVATWIVNASLLKWYCNIKHIT